MKFMKKIFLCLLVMIFMFGMCACGKIELTGDTNFIAHRGYSSEAHQNTEAAFSLAGENEGFWGIETDVQYTSDGKFVCSHDENPFYSELNDIKNLTYEAVMAEPLDRNKEIFLCDFNRYMDICIEYGKIAVIEIKFDIDFDNLTVNNDYKLDKVDELMSVIMQKLTVSQFVIICFENRYLDRIKETYPEVELYWLMSKGNLDIDKCIENGFNGSINYELVDEDVVNKFHAADLKLSIWTVNKQRLVEKYIKLGVDYITTNG